MAGLYRYKTDGQFEKAKFPRSLLWFLSGGGRMAWEHENSSFLTKWNYRMPSALIFNLPQTEVPPGGLSASCAMQG